LPQVDAGSGEFELRRTSAGVSVLLLAVVTIAIAEAALCALLVVFSYVLNLNLVLEMGYAQLVFQPSVSEYEVIEQGVPVIVGGPPFIELHGAAVIASIVSCAACGLVAAARTFRHWRQMA
jgi:hypothetical protein